MIDQLALSVVLALLIIAAMVVNQAMRDDK